ncbi:hypothetical protein [Pseudomonas sp. Irchel 3E13]|uniref:hypothetical protein n=1 Tax=Pseudomonas sp. Irchel 3E13 TaxID=2008975 RepID=UPI000BA2E1F6|nr:hypothetical protein [Pseudomonas sp. Irchel 3E13]
MARQKKDNTSQRSGRVVSDEMVISIATTPTSFIHPLTCDKAWASWYGSLEMVVAIRNEIIGSGIRLEGFTRSDLKLMGAGMLISTVLLNQDRREALEDLLGRQRVLELMPLSNLYAKTCDIIGAKTLTDLQHQLMCASSVELLQMAHDAFPQLGEVIEVGGFSTELMTACVMLRAILDSNLPQTNSWEMRYCVDMTVHLYLQMIPVAGIRTAILYEYPRFSEMYPSPFGLEEDLNPESPVFGSNPLVAGSMSAVIALLTVESRISRNSDPVDSMLETLQSFALAASPESRFTLHTILCLVDELNNAWASVIGALVALEVNSDELRAAGINLDDELIQSSLPYTAHLNLLVVDSARMIRRAALPMLTNQAYLEQAVELNNAIHDVKSEISAVTATGNFALLSDLSKKGSDLSGRRSQLAADALRTATKVMSLVKFFIDVASRAGEPDAVPIEAQAGGCASVQPASSELSPLRATDEFEGELLEINAQLETELKAAQAENYRLSSALDVLQVRLDQPAGTVDQDFQDLTRRQIFGQRLSPVELLRFYSYLAPDRLVVLESAWKSSRGAENFAYPERLAEQLCKLIYDYLDQVRNGSPMGLTGRELFAGAFSAKESQTVAQDHSMRAQREFNYNGELRFFEYRLRTGNGWGAVEGMRLYFDVIDDKVVIAYVGPHLDQASTN